MPAPIDWTRAEQIALKVAARRPLPTHGSIRSEDFVSLAPLAEERIEATTGLRSAAGPATIQVIDRAGWIRANIASFQVLLEPFFDKWSDAAGKAPKSHTITRQLAAAEVGVLLGWMSGRVLGQYDLLLSGPENVNGDGAVYLVGPNMLALENRFGFPPDEFRLWVALHELTHRAQFTGVPWMRDHFLGLVHSTVELADPDPARLMAALSDAMRDRDAARQRLRDGGMVAVVSTPEQQAVFNRVAGLMSLLEGHGDVVMDRAGIGLLPSAERFSRVLRERRQRANPIARLVQRLVGLEGKLNQYAAGERFIAAIEAVGGERAVDVCWTDVENLPTLDEIRTPELWLERVGLEPSIA